MIRGKHLHQELYTLDNKAKKGKGTISDILKGIGLIAKLLSDIRSNQVSIMKSKGIKLEKSYKERPEKKG